MNAPYPGYGDSFGTPSVIRTGDFSQTLSHICTGPQAAKHVDFPFSLSPVSYTVDVHQIHTEVWYKAEEDLDTALWDGELSWEFLQTGVVIGPLSAYEGSFSEHVGSTLASDPPPPKDALEKMSDIPAQQRWFELVREHRVGMGRIFRGLHCFRMPVALPARTTYAVRLSWPEPPVFQGQVRFKITLRGQYR